MIQSTLMTRYDAIYQALIELYGEPTWRQHLPPVDELVCTILSQNTNDVNRDVAFTQLQERFAEGGWAAVRDADPADVVEAIRPAGLANQKGPRIQNALREISRRQGDINLDFLKELPLDEARKWLTNLPGVGPKTAAIVLLFAFGRPDFPVDTHVHRLSTRLGLIPKGMSAERAHIALAELVPPEHYYTLHLNLIRHGRAVCKARKPLCAQCPLRPQCRYYQEEVRE